MPRKTVFTLLAFFALSIPVQALGFVIVGNEPIAGGYGTELLAAVNTPDRVYAYIHDWQLTFYFKSGPKALNEGMKRFAAIPANRREIILRPEPASPLQDGKYEYNWTLRLPGGRQGAIARGVVIQESEIADTRATLTIYIPEPRPLPLANPAMARKWIADLDNDDFKIRDRATKQLADLGTSVASILREALKGKPGPEARERMERLLGSMSVDLRVDTLEFPKDVPIVSIDTLLARGRKELASKRPEIRADAAFYLAGIDAPSEEVIPDLEKLLKTETYTGALAKVAQAAWRLGADAKPLLPLLKETAKSSDASLQNICQQAIANIEKASTVKVSDAEAKRRATIRNDIRDFVAGLEMRK